MCELNTPIKEKELVIYKKVLSKFLNGESCFVSPYSGMIIQTGKVENCKFTNSRPGNAPFNMTDIDLSDTMQSCAVDWNDTHIGLICGFLSRQEAAEYIAPYDVIIKLTIRGNLKSGPNYENRNVIYAGDTIVEFEKVLSNPRSF